jgi:hypothetical protein
MTVLLLAMMSAAASSPAPPPRREVVRASAEIIPAEEIRFDPARQAISVTGAKTKYHQQRQRSGLLIVEFY